MSKEGSPEPTTKERYQPCRQIECSRFAALCKTNPDGSKYFTEGDLAYTALVYCNNWTIGLSDGTCPIDPSVLDSLEQSETIKDSLKSLVEKLDEKTVYMSGGWERLPEFKKLVDSGEQALPFLIDQGQMLDWWRISAIFIIAEATGKPIQLPEESAGRHDEISAVISGWATEHGYIG